MINTPFLDLYNSYASDQTDAPKLYHQAMGYMVLSSIVNKKVWVPFGSYKLYPNLYLLIIGPSSLHRKSWSQKIGLRLIREIYPEFEIQETSSRESFISEISENERTPFGTGIIAIDELKGFMDRVKSSRFFGGFLQDLSSIYDGNDIRRRVGVEAKTKENYKVEDPFLNFTACCSFDWLSESIASSDLAGGFFSRFIWSSCSTPVSDPWPEPKPYNQEKRDILIGKLTRIKEFIGAATWDAEATSFYERWYKDFRTHNQGGRWDGSYERLTTTVKKLAMLNAVSRVECTSQELSPQIHIELTDLDQAIRFSLRTISHFKDVSIGNSPIDILTQKVAKKIMEKTRVAHSSLLQTVRGLTAKDLDQVMKTLIDGEMVKVVEEENAALSGRKYRSIHYEARNTINDILNN